MLCSIKETKELQGKQAQSLMLVEKTIDVSLRTVILRTLR